MDMKAMIDFNKRYSNNGLSEEDILKRNEALLGVFASVCSFNDEFNLGLPIDNYASLLSPGYSPNVHEDPLRRFDMSWFEWAKTKLKVDIKGELIRKILESIENPCDFSNPLLAGSAYSIAIKVTARYFDRLACLERDDFDVLDLFKGLDIEGLVIDSGELVESVARVFDEKYMRYRLWNESAIDRLRKYLFCGCAEDGDEMYFEEGAMAEDIEAGAELMDRNEFIERVAECIGELELSNGAEVSFPSGSVRGFKPRRNDDNEILFGEFVPFANAGDKIIDKFYCEYMQLTSSV